MFVKKISASVVHETIGLRVSQEDKAVLIHDGIDGIEDIRRDPRLIHIVDARWEKPEIIDSLTDECIFIYACYQDDLGVPFIERLHILGRKYYPVFSGKPEGYIVTNYQARKILEFEFQFQRAEGFAKWDYGYHDFANLIQALDVCRELPGCYLEVGCYRGSSAGIVLRYLSAVRRSMSTFFIDVFEGFNYMESKTSSDAFWQGTHVTEGVEEVRKRLLRYGANCPELSISVEVSNIITDPLPPAVIRQGIAVANLDVDLHEAVYAGLHKIAPHVVKSAIIIVEDPGHTPLLIGAKYALDKFLTEEIGREFVHIVMQSGQSFLIKK